MPEPPEIAQALASWGLQDAEVEASSTGNGLGAWFVRSASGEHVLRRLDGPDWATVEAALLGACRDLECVPKIVRTSGGDDYARSSDAVFQLQVRLPGADARGLRGEDARQAYTILARVHAALLSASPKDARPRDLYASYTGRIETAVQIATDRFPELRQVAHAGLDAWHEGGGALGKRPWQWIHGDTGGWNYLHMDGCVTALLDFSEARVDAPEWDLAGSLASFSRHGVHWAEDSDRAVSVYSAAGAELDGDAVRTAYIGWQLRGLAIWAEQHRVAGGQEWGQRMLEGLKYGLSWLP